MKNRLKDLRRKHGYSQDRLTEVLNVSRQTIISIEKGKYNPSLSLALQMKKSHIIVKDIFFYEDDKKREGKFILPLNLLKHNERVYNLFVLDL
ncbi:putative transcriptional regulator [Pullulanibacillus pueri]|uniref:Transcriptional regulator n=1 Tax=Pullulanibacillus pueri TaxID=1437324 RepID=A0A8J2ZYQ8_9BACL|nr:putative transcriptional regulator [Pullulanibacillus pueri]GGH86433.1 transcriptional regulator [Pullulanibacillus pueri]